jgi:glutathione S-transferase
MCTQKSMFSWEQLLTLSSPEPDRISGPTNSQARLRLFGEPETAVRVVLYRDHHAWCPYCQKVWLWLEEKQVPYRIEKVTMFCYGEKEAWFRKLVPSGMLPALTIDGLMITESDLILWNLECTFGILGRSIQDPQVLSLRQLERELFRAWCNWLCSPGQEVAGEQLFEIQVQRMALALEQNSGPFFFADFSSADLAFVPYVERMNSSLLYYKGYELRKRWPPIDLWFQALEQRSTYCGTRSDHHTHAHDLPPQMGGCFSNGSAAADYWSKRIDNGPWQELSDAGPPASGDDPAAEALMRVLKHRHTLLATTPGLSDAALRAALTKLISGETITPPPHSELGLRQLRDRICVPRDMGIHAARLLRAALEETAALAGSRTPAPLPRRHRRDQDPAPFLVHS